MVVRFFEKPVQINSGVFAAATAVCSKSQPFVPRHFPGFPIVPGVLIIDTCHGIIRDAAAQMGIVPQGKRLEIDSISSFKFTDPILPGDIMHVSCKLKEEVGELLEFQCLIKVNGKKRSLGNLTLRFTSEPAEQDCLTSNGLSLATSALTTWKWYDDFDVKVQMESATAKLAATKDLFASDAEGPIGQSAAEFPTVLLVEGLAQASVCFADPLCPSGFQTTFAMVHDATAYDVVRVGDEVDFGLAVLKPGPDYFRVLGRASVRGNLILEAEISLGFTSRSRAAVSRDESMSPVEPAEAV